MGTVFHLPIVRSLDLVGDVALLKQRCGVELIATVLSDQAEALSGAKRTRRVGLCFGGEAHGLSGPLIDQCDRRVTIPMQNGTDSLNVAVAAGIVMYHFCQNAEQSYR